MKFINNLKMLLLILITSIAMVGCGSSGGGDDGDDTSEKVFSTIDLSDAQSLFIGSSGSVVSSSIKLSVEDIGGIKEILYKITNKDLIEKVEFKDQYGDIFTGLSNPTYVESINDEYMIINFAEENYDANAAFLIKKDDGSVYNIGDMIHISEHGFKNAKAFKTDSSGNIFLTVNADNYSNDKKVIKISLNNEEITKSTISPSTDDIDFFEADKDGNIIYRAGDAGTNHENTFYRILKANGEVKNLPFSFTFWKGLDGVLYSNEAYTDNIAIVKHSISSTYEYEPTDIINAGGITCDINWESYILKTDISIVVTDGVNSTICEVYNSSMVPREFASDMLSIKDVQSNGLYYYFAGNNSASDPVLRRFNVVDDIYIDLLSAGDYDVYKFIVSDNDDITFNALRMSDGKKVIGTISSTGIIEIINETSNYEVVEMERVF